MNDLQWKQLLDVIDGKVFDPLPVGYIIDSPWLPGWYGTSILDYFTSDDIWFEANKKAVETFSDVIFLPGFWSEFGMCTEPSAFGAKCTWQENDLPHAAKIIDDVKEIDKLTVPNPAQDGLAPFVLNRLKLNRKRIEKLGHSIRFAVARGPLNIASFLMGTTEFLIGLRMETEKIHKFLKIITEYTVEWIRLQKKEIDSIDGILILDDIVGFCGESDYKEFAEPYLKEIFNCIDASVKFFHNDADGKGCSKYLADAGINMFNFSFLHPMDTMQEWTDNKVVLFGNIPPRDVLALGTPEQIRTSVSEAMGLLKNKSRVIMSVGGGMSGGVSSENINAMIDAVRQ